MAIGKPHISIITLNVNGLNSPIKSKKAQSSGLDQKAKLDLTQASGDTSQLQRQIQTQSEGVENDTPSKWHQRKASIAVLISDKTDFKIKR